MHYSHKLIQSREDIVEDIDMDKKRKTWSDDALDGLAAIVLMTLFVVGVVYWLEVMT